MILCYRCVKLLFKYGADLKVKVSEKGDTALHIAARKGHLEILKFLLSQGLDPELRYVANICIIKFTKLVVKCD